MFLCLAVESTAERCAITQPFMPIRRADVRHEMILFSADLQTVYKRLAARRKEASLVEQEQRRIRIPQDAVRGCDEAPNLQETTKN